MTLVWRPGYGGAAVSDPDAMTYLRAVEEADNQPLEQGVQQAVNQFVIGCKNDGIWDAIKACCILAGARTLSGALVPLVGTAPTNNNFVAGDYDRETGLVGNGSTKYLDSNRLDSADPQNNHHLSVYITAHSSVPYVSNFYAGVLGTSPALSYSVIQRSSAGFMIAVSRAITATPTFGSVANIGFYGTTRASSTKFSYKGPGAGAIEATASATATVGINMFIFARNRSDTGLSDPVNARLSFYSIGESLDLALLDTRVSDLITAIGAAIP